MENSKKRLSVAMATFNGEKYIKQQIETILLNLNKDDEVVISDDASTDNTLNIIKEFINNDKRIKLIEGPKNGIKQNFANAIQNCNGEYIFLADQDDIWDKNKVEEVLKAFKEEKTTLVIHDAEIINENEKIIEKSFFKYRKSGKRYNKEHI